MPYRHVTEKERYFIYNMNLAGWSPAKIGRAIDRHRSTIGRELKRNANRAGQYLDDYAERQARERRRSAAHRDCSGDANLMDHVERKLRTRWSPEQIAGRLKIAPPVGLDLIGGHHTN